MGMNKQWNMKVFELHELEESENNNSEATEELNPTEEPNPTENPDQQNGSTTTEEPNPTENPETVDDNPSLP